MTAIGTRENMVSSQHVDLTPDEFERRLASHGHAADEIHGLWAELVDAEQERPSPRPGLALGPSIAVYLGLLLVVAASVSLLAIYWDGLGTSGVLAVALTYVAVYLGASETLRRHRLIPPADVLEAASVAWVGLATYAVADLVGLWPADAEGLEHIHVGLTLVAAVGLTAAIALQALRPDPFLILPAAAATGLLALDLAELAFGGRLDELSGRQAAAFVLPVGLAWIAGGLWLDITSRREYATWAHWAGLVLTSAAIMAMVPKTVPGFTLIGILGAVSLFFSAFVRHWSFTVIGALGVLLATTSALGLLGGIAPLLIAVVGIALIFVGLRWSRWRDSIRAAVLARIPGGARGIVTRLAPH